MKIKTLKRSGIGLAILVGVIIIPFIIIYFVPFAKTKGFIANDYKYGSDYYKELDDIPVMSQATGHTCYIVSIAIVKNYFGVETTEHSLRSDLGLLDRPTGMLPNEYLNICRSSFDPLSLTVSQVNPTSQAEILNVISDSLENNMPIIIFYSTADDWNKPNYNTHYAVVYGIDMKSEVIKASNPYGYLDELSFQELYDGLDFSSYKAEPFSFRLARKVGMIKSNTLLVFKNIS